MGGGGVRGVTGVSHILIWQCSTSDALPEATEPVVVELSGIEPRLSVTYLAPFMLTLCRALINIETLINLRLLLDDITGLYYCVDTFLVNIYIYIYTVLLVQTCGNDQKW